jgi:hypothetical protein
MTFEVRVRLGALFGGNEKSVRVEAPDEAQAIAKAALELDDEGIDTFALLRVVKETS